MPSIAEKMKSRRPPRPQRFFSDDAGILPGRNGVFHNPEDWEGPDVSLPPITQQARPKTAERRGSLNSSRGSLNSSGHDVSPRRSGKEQEKPKSDPFRHRGRLMKRSSNDRMQNFENKVISLKTGEELACGDLSCSSEFQVEDKPSAAIEQRGVFDRREENSITSKSICSSPRRRIPLSNLRKSDPSHNRFGSARDDVKAPSFIPLSDLCNAWKDDGSRVSASPCKSNITAQTESSTRSWASSDLELDLEDDDSLSSENSTNHSRQIELQEEAMIALAMERSMADVSFEVGDNSSVSSFDHPSVSSSINFAAAQQLKNRRQQQKIGRPTLRPSKSQLSGAGCHLSMIANNMKNRKKPASRSNLPPMLGINRTPSSEEFELLESAPAKPSNTSRTDSFVWERDTVTKRWYKRPVREINDKSEDDCILEKVAELSMRDALKTSLGELQEVAQIRNIPRPNHW